MSIAPVKDLFNPQHSLFSTPCIKNAIHSFVNEFFELAEFLIEKASIPLRFTGSKFITLPELVIRIVVLIKNLIFERAPAQFHKLILDTGYSLSMDNLPTDLAPTALKFARFDTAVHTDNPEWLPSNCIFKGSYINKGLKIVLIEELTIDETPKLHVVFAAKGAAGTKDFNTENLKNVVLNMLGGITDNYFEAEQTFLSLKKNYPNFFENHDVILSGLCLGGSLASFVALRQNQKAICLNSLGLSPSAQWHIGRDRLQKAPTLITHVSAQGDFASAPPIIVFAIDFFLNLIGFRTIGNFGKRYVIPHAKEHNGSLDKIHCLMLASLARYIDPNVRINKSTGRLQGGIEYLHNRDLPIIA